jgi:Tol biopolymer transport system component
MQEVLFHHVRSKGLVLGVALAVALASCSTNGGGRKPGTGRIVFLSRREEGGGGIYAVNADGSGLKRLSSGDNPALSSDGTRIAFSGFTEIDVMDAEGGGKRTIARSANFARLVGGAVDALGSPDWSPDGTKVAFTVIEGPERLDIGVANSDGTGSKLLTRNGGGEPAWSPDGKEIAFVSSIQSENFPQAVETVYVMNADGTGSRVLTDTPAVGMTPVWSPDGSKIAFAGARVPEEPSHIYVVNLDGTGLTRLTAESVGGNSAAWSPDGSTIAFVAQAPEPILGGIIVTVRSDGTGEVKLKTLAATEETPAWSANGKQIAFVGEDERTQTIDLFVINADGTGSVRLTNDDAGEGRVAWEP